MADWLPWVAAAIVGLLACAWGCWRSERREQCRAEAVAAHLAEIR